MHRWRAWFVAVWLCALVTATPLIACPILQAQIAPDQSGSCCRREPASPDQHCPFSSNLEACPYYVSESKLGTAADSAKAAPPLPVLIAVAAPTSLTPIRRFHYEPRPVQDEDSLFLRIRVLRI
jgi:hypothetical protein